MKIKTNVGELDVLDEDILVFNRGLPGFEELRRFALIALNETHPIQWLVSLENETISLPVMDPWLVRKDYDLNIPKDLLEFLGIEDKEKILVLGIVRIPGTNPQDLTINLAAPVIINLENNQGIQYIPQKSRYNLRHSIKEEMKRSKKLSGQKTDGDN